MTINPQSKNVLHQAMLNLYGPKRVAFSMRLTAVRIMKRQRLWVEQDGRCHYCKCDTQLPDRVEVASQMATLDHIVTQSEGGTDSLNNLVVACLGCNQVRGNMLYDEFIAAIKKAGSVGALKMELARERKRVKSLEKIEKQKAHHALMADQKQAKIARLAKKNNTLPASNAKAIRREKKAAKAERNLTLVDPVAKEQRLVTLRKYADQYICKATEFGLPVPSQDSAEFEDWLYQSYLQNVFSQRNFGDNCINLLTGWLKVANVNKHCKELSLAA